MRTEWIVDEITANTGYTEQDLRGFTDEQIMALFEEIRQRPRRERLELDAGTIL